MCVARLREQLEDRRRAGTGFAAAWAAALDALEDDDREEWGEALEATAASWRAACQARPATRAEWALHAAGWDPEREGVDLPDPWERRCPVCGDRLAADKRPSARFCSRACQRRPTGRRVAA